jgi:hypothetical protein
MENDSTSIKLDWSLLNRLPDKMTDLSYDASSDK